ncbi:MAG: HK97 gp10 family phage protein, partial [Pseudomonadota bacterium]|nr:HK97 gp10 family phage protein [Pseudomonadota bacterium]
GRARANWQVTIGTVPNGTLDLTDKTGQATISRATATAAGLKAGDVIYMVNNLPYIQRLEDGYSGQAPAGMVGLAVQDFQEIARQVGFELVVI